MCDNGWMCSWTKWLSTIRPTWLGRMRTRNLSIGASHRGQHQQLVSQMDEERQALLRAMERIPYLEEKMEKQAQSIFSGIAAKNAEQMQKVDKRIDANNANQVEEFSRQLETLDRAIAQRQEAEMKLLQQTLAEATQQDFKRELERRLEERETKGRACKSRSGSNRATAEEC